jgi:hydroxymethylbilane synthase
LSDRGLSVGTCESAFHSVINWTLKIVLPRDTRVAKLDAPDGPYTAIILAKAGLVRYGMAHRITVDLGAPTLYHAVSQGALGVEIRTDDAAAIALLAPIIHAPSEWSTAAERACLRVLEGGCSVPVGVNSALVDGKLRLTGCVTALQGNLHVEHTLDEPVKSKADAEALGARLAHILIDTGAKEILDEVAIDRERRAGQNKTAQEVQKIEAVMEGAVPAPA